jgi:hypothetical protein
MNMGAYFHVQVGALGGGSRCHGFRGGRERSGLYCSPFTTYTNTPTCLLSHGLSHCHAWRGACTSIPHLHMY